MIKTIDFEKIKIQYLCIEMIDYNDLAIENSNKIRDISVRRGWYTKMRIKRILRRELTPEDYRKNAASLVNAILDEAAQIKEEDLITILESANV